jgi:small subunit ribosomal protein S5
MARFEREPSEFKERSSPSTGQQDRQGRPYLQIRRDVVVGNEKGKVGFGLGKASEVPEAIRKASRTRRRTWSNVTLSGTTIPHEVVGEFGAGRVLLKPPSPGTGVIAGGPVRAVLESGRYQGHPHEVPALQQPQNVVTATMEGLSPARARGSGPHQG